MIVVGIPEDGAQAFFDSLLKAKRRTIVICGGSAPVDRLREAGIGVLFGSPSDPMVLVQAHVLSAGVLVIPSGTAAEAKDVVDAARKLNKTLPIVVLTKTIDDGVFFDQTDKNLKILCEPLVTSLTVAATAIEELFQREESEAEEEANRKTVREIINEEYMRTVAAVRTGGASDAAESQSDKLQAAAVTVADEAMSEAKRQTPAQKHCVKPRAAGAGGLRPPSFGENAAAITRAMLSPRMRQSLTRQSRQRKRRPKLEKVCKDLIWLGLGFQPAEG